MNTATFSLLITGVLDCTTRERHGPGRGAHRLPLHQPDPARADPGLRRPVRQGRIRIHTCGAVGIALWAVPQFLLIGTGSPLRLAVGTCVASCFLSSVSGHPRAVLFAELFAPEMRHTGASSRAGRVHAASRARSGRGSLAVRGGAAAVAVLDRDRDTATPARHRAPPARVSAPGTSPSASQDISTTRAGTA